MTAVHTSSIVENDVNVYLGEPAGFVVKLETGQRFYFAGDTALFGDMRLIGEMYAPEIAFLPIGDYYTMGPEAAARACQMLGIRQVVPMHFGTFPDPHRHTGAAPASRRTAGHGCSRPEAGGDGELRLAASFQLPAVRPAFRLLPEDATSGSWHAGG